MTGAEENHMNNNLSQIVAELFARSQGSEEVSSYILRLRDEIKKVTEREEAIYGKFRGLLESFREVIPDEKQRYHAAIKALSSTSKLSQLEIVKAIGSQLEELKILEKSLLSPLPGWHVELKAMEARAKEKSDEISKLREQIARLETEEEGIRKGKDAREKIMELAEQEMKELFTDIGTEITSIKKKAEEFSAESEAVQPVPQKAPAISDVPVVKKGGSEQNIEINAAPAPQDTEFEKKCPMCGGRMNLHTTENLWMCYSCAYEEANKEPGVGKQKSEIRETSAPRDTQRQKKCPMCGGRMDFFGNERMWQCYSCAFEESEKDEMQGVSAENSEQAPSFTVPLADMSSDEYRETEKKSSQSGKHPTKTKPCPSCRKKMFWFPDESAWRCPSCQYMTRSLN